MDLEKENLVPGFLKKAICPDFVQEVCHGATLFQIYWFLLFRL